MNGNIEESVEGMKVIKVFNHEQQAFDEFEETNESFRKAATNANFFSGIMVLAQQVSIMQAMQPLHLSADFWH